MGSIYYTSDIHHGHRLVADLRGFDDVEDHDAALAANWDKTVRPDDTVWVLGDLCRPRHETGRRSSTGLDRRAARHQASDHRQP